MTQMRILFPRNLQSAGGKAMLMDTRAKETAKQDCKG